MTPYLKDIEKLIGKNIPEVKDHPYPMLSTTQPLITEPNNEIICRINEFPVE
jgi:hypothetical protein